jgi:GNAT superfamily N-acetyltransferase
MHTSLTVRIVEEIPARLGDYARVSIGFMVEEILDEQAVAALLRGEPAASTPLAAPRWKDYDTYPDNKPTDWARRFDLSRWTILAAFLDDQRVGGAVIICNDPHIDLLRDCDRCGLLWDLRVAPAARGRGVGSALVQSIEAVAFRSGARALRVETQQVNVPACRFYARHGFRLERAIAGAYEMLPEEMQLLWRKQLVQPSASSG